MRVTERRTMKTFSESWRAAKVAIAKAGMTVFADIDHAGAARGVGLEMPATRVLLYGNPLAGTPLMMAAPLVALDLPLRLLVRELPGNHSAIAYHEVSESLKEIGVEDDAAALLNAVQHTIADAIAPINCAEDRRR